MGCCFFMYADYWRILLILAAIFFSLVVLVYLVDFGAQNQQQCLTKPLLKDKPAYGPCFKRINLGSIKEKRV